MAADNDLYKQAQISIEEMLAIEIPNEYNLLTYIDTPNSNPYLLKLTKGKTDTLNQYSKQNSASKQVLKSIIDETFSLFPAESYGLILWSHGTGWLPEGVYDHAKELEPLASLVKEAIKNETHLICPNRELIQRYDTKEPALLFDFEDYLQHAISNESDLTALRNQLSKTVIYNDFTSSFLNEISIEKSSGIGIYIPFTNDALFSEYSLLDWYKDSELFCNN